MATWYYFIFRPSAFQVVALSAFIVCIAISISLIFFSIRYPRNLPLVREKEGKTRFRLRTRLAYYTDCGNLYRDAYENFSRKGKTCLVPSLGLQNQVVLPSRSIRWMISQPDNVLGIYEAFLDVTQAYYNLGSNKYLENPWHGLLVKLDLNRILESLMVALDEELQFAFDQRFGMNAQEWIELPLLQTMKVIVAQGSSRFTVGLPLCRNEEYLNNSMKFANTFVAVTGFIGVMPRILRPLIGLICSLPQRSIVAKEKKLLKPEFQKRMEKYIQKTSDWEVKEPQDHLQIMLRYAQANHPEELNLHDITTRIAISNIGSFHQTSFAATNVLLNILASDKEYNTISILRDEFATVLGTSRDIKWTKARVSKLVRTDSVIRETLRMHSYGNRAVLRKVVVDGLKTEDGVVLPKGAMVSVLTHPLHCDEEIYSNPEKFDPWRFSRLREATAASDPNNNALNWSFISTGVQNMVFGHGKHACPGRFILDFELKMIVSYLLVNYDVTFPEEYKGVRPETKWLAEIMMPPSWAKIMVKRRAV